MHWDPKVCHVSQLCRFGHDLGLETLKTEIQVLLNSACTNGDVLMSLG